MNDYFAVFDLPRRLTVDTEALQRRFYELSRQHHPDFHQTASPEGQAAALARSALVNRAYRALREPLARVEYLIALEEGRETREGGEERPRVPAELLEEMLAVQEALQDAKASGLDAESAPRLRAERDRLLARQQQLAADIVGRAPEWDAVVDRGDDRRPLLEWFKQALATRAYLRTVIEDLGQALGEDQEAHVSHRRH